MSREIKFRIWDGERYWYNVAPLNDNKALTQELTSDECCFEYDNQYTTRKGDVEQFTGLVDKNGKEIYEGDIVRIKDRIIDHKNGDQEKDVWFTSDVVRIDEEGVLFEEIPYGDLYWHRYKEHCNVYGDFEGDFRKIIENYAELEIIGTEHENPELLEVRNDYLNGIMRR